RSVAGTRTVRDVMVLDDRAVLVFDVDLGHVTRCLVSNEVETAEQRRDVLPCEGSDTAGRTSESKHHVSLAQHGTLHGIPLRLIAVEQRRIGPTTADEREFPGEIHGILDARIHSLTAGRAVDVGRVARKKYAS